MEKPREFAEGKVTDTCSFKKKKRSLPPKYLHALFHNPILLLWKAPYNFKRQEYAKGSICWEEVTASIATECSLHSLLEQKATKTNLIFLQVTLTFPALEYNKREVSPVEQDQQTENQKHTQSAILMFPGLSLWPSCSQLPLPTQLPPLTQCHPSALSRAAVHRQLQMSICTEPSAQVRAANFTFHNNNSQWNRLEVLRLYASTHLQRNPFQPCSAPQGSKTV